MGIKPGTLHAEKQMEKDSIEGYGGIQRDFGVKGSIERDNGFIAREDLELGEVICSLPGDQSELGKVLCGLGGTFEIGGDEIGVGLRDAKPTDGDGI